MSWILGHIGERISESTRRALKSLHGDPLLCRESGPLYLAAGGLAETCFSGDSEAQATGWLVTGLGLERVGDHCRVLSRKDWHSRIADEFRLGSLDGHYVALRWSLDELHVLVDPLGLRTIYFVESDNGLSFSTRLDWLSSLTGRSNIDLEAFGGHWLLFNQMTQSRARDSAAGSRR